jgi:hypothetical protein
METKQKRHYDISLESCQTPLGLYFTYASYSQIKRKKKKKKLYEGKLFEHKALFLEQNLL